MSTIGGSIARVEIEFQHLRPAESLGAAQQTDREEICIPPPTALMTLLVQPPHIFTPNALLVLNPTTPQACF